MFLLVSGVGVCWCRLSEFGVSRGLVGWMYKIE